MWKKGFLTGSLFVFVLFPPLTWSQPAEERLRLYVMLAGTAEAPTPEEVVEDWDFSSPPPTEGLGAQKPMTAWYLLPRRAEGDFKALLDANPDTARSRLERYIVVEYPGESSLDEAMSALNADSNIEAAMRPVEITLSSSKRPAHSRNADRGQLGSNYGLEEMSLPEAWALVSGHAFIGVVDTGLATEHPELQAFTAGGAFTDGGFLPVYSLDLGRWPNAIDDNVDELEPEVVQNPDPSCPTDGNGMAQADFAGHGTHVAGLLVANHQVGDTKGVCKGCGIGMWRTSYLQCVVGAGVRPTLNSDATAAAVSFLGDAGAQAISMSWGFAPQQADYCAAMPNDPFCLAYDYVESRQIALVGASGNHRDPLQFPARDGRVVAAGGFDEQLLLWDEARPPNSIQDCPYWPTFGEFECGSNWTTSTGGPKQETIAASRQVFGLTYPGMDWNSTVGCGDSFGPGTTTDGTGNCTGTSMSAPQITGLIGLMRSANPLVGAGDPESPTAFGMRDVLASTTFRSQAGQPWSAQLGYGRPDAEQAVRAVLGEVSGQTAKNRAIPMFSFYGDGSDDYAYTTSPQTSISFMISNASNYSPIGTSIPGYSDFPDDPLLGPSDTPKAATFVMATAYLPVPGAPDLVPLYMADRSRHFPVGCNPNLSSCNTNNRDFLLATGEAELESLHASGYEYRGIEGYVYERCTPEPACIPEGAERLWRKCKTADDDCAIFLESERASFEAAGYTVAFPTGFSMHIGYAYPNVDADSDGLVDGFELLVGTDPDISDTDGDGASDGTEFPLAGISDSDPCEGPLDFRCRGVDLIFEDRFED